MKIRVGFGFDVHRLVPGRELWLGGIRLEHELGLLGHSDADVLIHAICDALLGAANLRDIGYHFPDNSVEFKNIDSKILLAETVELIAEKGYRVGNIDATVCAERPKLKNVCRTSETEKPHSGNAGSAGKGDGRGGRRCLHQGNHDRETGIYRTGRRYLSVCHGVN